MGEQIQITAGYVAQMQKVTSDATVKAVREWVAQQRDFCQQQQQQKYKVGSAVMFHYWGGRADSCTTIIDYLDGGLAGG